MNSLRNIILSSFRRIGELLAFFNNREPGNTGWVPNNIGYQYIGYTQYIGAQYYWKPSILVHSIIGYAIYWNQYIGYTQYIDTSILGLPNILDQYFQY